MKRERTRALRADILADEARRAELDRRAGRKPKISKIAPPPEDIEDLETLQVWLREKEVQIGLRLVLACEVHNAGCTV